MTALNILAPDTGLKPACSALGISRSSIYRHAEQQRHLHKRSPTKPRAAPPLALHEDERAALNAILCSERFADNAPPTIYATLLDEGVYLASVSTMYRILKSYNATRERRNQSNHPVYCKPELLATEPNQVWSWDITKLRGPVKWSYFHLYVILDIFSRCVVGWMVAHRETAELAEQLIAESISKQKIPPGQLTLHADRGTSMKSKTVAQLLIDLEVAKSHSRPHVSDDNPYSEAQFKTMKYHREFPQRFGSIEDARSFCQRFFAWYNNEHRHSGIGYMTPAAMHSGQAQALRDLRQLTLDEAFRKNPVRFKNRLPKPPELPSAAWINPPKENFNAAIPTENCSVIISPSVSQID